MPLRFYICDVIGTGADGGSPEESDPYRPAVYDYTPNVVAVEDGRVDQNSAAGFMMAALDPSPEVHALLLQDTRIRYIPFETAGGAPLGLDDPVSQMPAARRTAIRAALENHGVPMDDLTGTNTVRDVVRRIAQRFKQRQYLGSDDFGALDVQVGALNSARRSRIAYRLQGMGFDLSGITGATTIREALKLLRAQTARTYAWTDEAIPLGNNLTGWE